MKTPLPLNASSHTAKRQKVSSNDTRVVHPYVVQKKQEMRLSDDKSQWTSSKIKRRKNRITGQDEIISITVFQI
jgi:hypothetical protein